ncbi:hypothetical protein ACCD10_28275 [Pseudomonas sp. Pseusp122]
MKEPLVVFNHCDGERLQTSQNWEMKGGAKFEKNRGLTTSGGVGPAAWPLVLRRGTLRWRAFLNGMAG